VTLFLTVAMTNPVAAQVPVPPAGRVPAAAKPDLPPATKLEGFMPTAGSVLTIGYDELGRTGYPPVSIDVREMRDAKGQGVRGLLVEVSESDYRKERSFVDADEIPELLNAVDTLLAVKVNPTSFKNFEVRYTTRGDLQLTAFSDSKGKISYAVQTGRIGKANSYTDESGMLKLRGMFEAALQKLNAAGSGR
jgi:hypothetical protein